MRASGCRKLTEIQPVTNTVCLSLQAACWSLTIVTLTQWFSLTRAQISGGTSLLPQGIQLSYINTYIHRSSFSKVWNLAVRSVMDFGKIIYRMALTKDLLKRKLRQSERTSDITTTFLAWHSQTQNSLCKCIRRQFMNVCAAPWNEASVKGYFGCARLLLSQEERKLTQYTV